MQQPHQFQDTSRSLAETLRAAIALLDGAQVTLRQMLELFGEQGLLILCALLSLPFLIPVSIPGVSTVFGAGIVLIGVAVTLNRLPWMPERIMDRRIETARLLPALEKGAALVSRVDRYVKPRLFALTSGGVVQRLNGAVLTLAGVLLMAPLGLIPFSNTLPAVGIILISVGLIQRDGLMLVAGYAFVVLTLVYFGFLGWGALAAGRSLTGLGS